MDEELMILKIMKKERVSWEEAVKKSKERKEEEEEKDLTKIRKKYFVS